MKTVTIKYAPERHVEGLIPSIDIPDPIKPSDRFVPDLIVGDDDEFYFEMSEIHARRILAMDPDHYKLWSPYQLRVAMPGAHGGMETVTLTSIDPKCKPVDPIVLKVAADKAKGVKKEKAEVPATPPVPAVDPLADLDEISSPEGKE